MLHSSPPRTNRRPRHSVQGAPQATPPLRRTSSRGRTARGGPMSGARRPPLVGRGSRTSSRGWSRRTRQAAAHEGGLAARRALGCRRLLRVWRTRLLASAGLRGSGDPALRHGRPADCRRRQVSDARGAGDWHPFHVRRPVRFDRIGCSPRGQRTVDGRAVPVPSAGASRQRSPGSTASKRIRERAWAGSRRTRNPSSARTERSPSVRQPACWPRRRRRRVVSRAASCADRMGAVRHRDWSASVRTQGPHHGERAWSGERDCRGRADETISDLGVIPNASFGGSRSGGLNSAGAAACSTVAVRRSGAWIDRPQS